MLKIPLPEGRAERDDGWMDFINHGENPGPLAYRRIWIWRPGWGLPEAINVHEMHSQNVWGLLWKPYDGKIPMPPY